MGSILNKNDNLEFDVMAAQRLCLEYLKDFNFKEALKRSNLEDTDLLYFKPLEKKFKEEFLPLIKMENKKMVEKLRFDVQDVINGIAEIAFADIEEGSKIKVEHKLKALDMLGRHFGIYEKDNIQTTNLPPSSSNLLQVEFIPLGSQVIDVEAEG